MPGGALNMNNVSLNQMVTFAYDIQNFQLSGGPSWAATARFDVVAKPERPDASHTDDAKVTAEEHRAAFKRLTARLRTLLADRFQLEVSKETREAAGFGLVIGKSGHKLKPADEASDGVTRNRGQMTGTAVAMPIFANVLSMVMRKTVVDQTELKGKYSFKLEWSEEASGVGKEGDAPVAAEGLGPTIFTALQEQLGLKLEPRKVPIDYITIVRAEKPTEN
jgi:uncharacterized protein (TIGR03435 family)